MGRSGRDSSRNIFVWFIVEPRIYHLLFYLRKIVSMAHGGSSLV